MLRQFTIYDDGIETDRRPCRYRFHRYIGQEVYHTNDPNDICVVEEIKSPYYTRIRSKKKGVLLIGTPTTIYPVDRSEQKGDFSSDELCICNRTEHRKAKIMSFNRSKRMGVHKVVRGVQPDSDSGGVWSVRKDDPKSDSWEAENKTYTHIPGG